MKIKYALLALKQPAFFPDFNDLAVDKSIVTKNIDHLFKEQDIIHWKEWLGTILWESLHERDIFFITWEKTETSDILDGENNSLVDIIYGIYCSFLTLGSFYTFGEEPFVLTGSGDYDESIKQLSFRDIRQFTKFRPDHEPSYYRDNDYFNWITRNTVDAGIVQRIISFSNLIEAKLKNPEVPDYGKLVLKLAMYSLHNAINDDYRDFKIPNLVRSLETIIAIPRREGKRLFAERASKFLPDFTKVPFEYDQNRISEYLENIFQIRSDCLHGKPITGVDEQVLGIDFYKLDYLLETVCKNAIKHIVYNTDFLKSSENREELESNWQRNAFTFNC